jgi:DNA-binding transcriptional ArsR family regulator
MDALRYFITSKAKRNLLRFFFSSNETFYTRQIARLTGEPLNAIRRELSYLEKAGLLHSYMEGNQKYYGVVKSFPLLAEWKKIILQSGAINVAGPAVTSNPEAVPAEEEPIIPAAQVVMRPPAKAVDEQGIEEEQIAEPAPEHTQGLSGHTVSTVVEYLGEQFKEINSIALAVIHGDSARSEEVPGTGIDLLVVGDINKDALLELIANIEDSTGVHINLTSMTRSDFDYRSVKGDTLIRRIWGEKKLVVKGRH